MNRDDKGWEKEWGALPKLPDLREYANSLFDAYGYYRHLRRDKEVELTCSECGETMLLVDTKTADRDFTLGVPENTYVKDDLWEIKAGGRGICPCCGAEISYKQKGRVKKNYRYWNSFLYGQCEKDGKTLWLRNFSTWKEYDRDNGAVTSFRETERIRLCSDKKPEKYKYEKYFDNWTMVKTTRFGDLDDGEVHPDTWEAIGKSFLKYADIRVWYDATVIERSCGNYCYATKEENSVKLIRICAEFAYNPILEYLDKAGYSGIVERQIKGHNIVRRRGKKPWDRLQVTKKHMNLLKDEPEWLWILQQERRRKENWKLEEILWITSGNGRNAREILELKSRFGVSYIKQRNYMQKQKNSSVRKWLDYLEMKREAGYEMDSIATFPKDLQQAHERIVDELNEERDRKRVCESEEKFADIRKNFKKIAKKYAWHKAGMSIRPALSAKEIIEEGRALHHCVGASDTYMRRHNEGESYILFLRTETFKPYATIEIDANTNEIRQWYQAYDRKPDQEVIDPWLKEYRERLAKKKGA